MNWVSARHLVFAVKKQSADASLALPERRKRHVADRRYIERRLCAPEEIRQRRRVKQIPKLVCHFRAEKRVWDTILRVFCPFVTG